MLNNFVIAIVQKINAEFGNEFTIYQDGVTQGLKEPCFFIMLLLANQKQVIGNRYFREQFFDIHYFPRTNSNVEIFDVADKLKDVLEYIKIDDYELVRGTKMSHEVVDGVLHFFVSYDLFIYKEKEFVETMEDLRIERGLKER